MAEEQACLVRARSDSENSSKHSFGAIARAMAYTEDRLTDGSGDPGCTSMTVNPPETMDNESGELIDYSDTSMLEQFHEDALRQAGCGVSQSRIYLACGLALAGATLELSAIPFVLPSCEIELCIRPHEKNWLATRRCQLSGRTLLTRHIWPVLISLVGGGLGAVGWGALASRLGRRRALMSALAVNAVFAAIAAFMPTYGTFMMARFCSATGSGGIVPTTYAYCQEVSPRVCRRRALALLVLAAAGGAIMAAGLARAVLPPTGAAALKDDKEHFSAWHRYLLLCTLPILASLVSLIWTQESPRYLLDVGREVDAMLVYQSVHSGNQLLSCFGAGEDGYRPGAPPAKRPAPALHHVRHSVKMFWQAFFQLFSSAYRNNTLSLGGVMLFSMAIQFFLSSYIPSAVLSIENQEFEASKRIIQNVSYENNHFNQTLENIEYANVSFYNSTFRDLMLSHVSFRNCSFYDVVFSNIKTSYAYFTGSLFVNSTIIDTDITVGREIDADSVLNSTVIRGMRLACSRHAPLTWRLRGLLDEQTNVSIAMLVAAAIAAMLAPQLARTGRFAPRVFLCAICVCLSPSIYLVQSETALYVVEAVYRLFTTLVFYIVCVAIVENYPANLRCTAHGLIMCVTYMTGAVVRGIGEVGPIYATVICLVMASAATALAFRHR